MWRSWNEAVIWEKDDEEAQSLPRGGHISTDTKGQMSQDFLDVNSAAAGTIWEGKGWVHLWKMTATTTEAGHLTARNGTLGDDKDDGGELLNKCRG